MKTDKLIEFFNHRLENAEDYRERERIEACLKLIRVINKEEDYNDGEDAEK